MMTSLSQLLSKVTTLGKGTVKATDDMTTVHPKKGFGFDNVLKAISFARASQDLKTGKPFAQVTGDSSMPARLPQALGAVKSRSPLHLKASDNEAVEADLSTLVDLVQLLAQQSQSDKTPLEFEFESESTGKLNLRFDPETQSLSILASEGEQTSMGRLVKQLREAGFSSVKVVVGAHASRSKLKSTTTRTALRPATTSVHDDEMAPRVGIRSGRVQRLEPEAPRSGGHSSKMDGRVRLASKDVLNSKASAATATKAAGTSLPGKKSQPSASSKHMVVKNDRANIPASKEALRLGPRAATSRKVAAVVATVKNRSQTTRTDRQVSVKAKKGQDEPVAKVTQSSTATARTSGSANDGHNAAGIAAKTALPLLARLLRGSGPATASTKEQRVTVNLDKIGKVTATSAGSESGPGVEVASEGRVWLKRALADFGIDIHETKIKVQAERVSEKEVHPGRMSLQAAVRLRPNGVGDAPVPASATEERPASDKAILLLAKLTSKKQAKLLPSHERQPIVKNLEELAQKIEKAATAGTALKHTLTVSSKAAGELLQTELPPVVEQLAKSGVKLEQLTLVDKHSGTVKEFTSDTAAVAVEAGDKKDITTHKLRPASQLPSQGDSEDALDSGQDDAAQDKGRKSFTGSGGFSGTKDIPPARGDRKVSTESGQPQFVTALSDQGKFTLANGKAVTAKPVAPSRLTEMIEKIAELSKVQMATANQKIAVQLDVQDMGKVMVDALKHHDKVHLQVHVETAELRRLVEQQLQPLIDKVAKDGIDIGKLDVSVRDQRSEQQSGDTFTGHHDGRQKHDFGDAGERLGREDSTTTSRQMQPVRNAVRSGKGKGTMEIWA